MHIFKHCFNFTCITLKSNFDIKILYYNITCICNSAPLPLVYMFDISVYYIFIYFINHAIATCVGKRSKFKQPLFNDRDLKYDDAMFGEELF